jgi:hypothetical protein
MMEINKKDRLIEKYVNETYTHYLIYNDNYTKLLQSLNNIIKDCSEALLDVQTKAISWDHIRYIEKWATGQIVNVYFHKDNTAKLRMRIGIDAYEFGNIIFSFEELYDFNNILIKRHKETVDEIKVKYYETKLKENYNKIKELEKNLKEAESLIKDTPDFRKKLKEVLEKVST